MKIVYTLLIGLLWVSCNSPQTSLEEENNQLKKELELYKSLELNRQKAVQHADTRMFKLENEREILSVLFDTEDFDINGYAVWSPNFGERVDFPISYDGYCYTKMDKVLLYNDDFQRAIVVLGTYEIMDTGSPNDGHGMAPMLSIAYFTQRSGGWELSSFKKTFVPHGSWGMMGDVDLRQLGKRKFALELSWGYTNMGESSSYTTLYSIPMFEPIFGITTGYAFAGFEDGDGRAYSYDTELIVKPSDKEYYDIVAVTSGTKPGEPDINVLTSDDEENDVEEIIIIVSANEDRTFYFDEQAGVYVEYKIFSESDID